MLERYTNLIRAISVNWLGKLGVVLTTSSFVTFLFLQAALLTGLLRNAYAGLIIYLLFPALFVIGLLCIPVGWNLQRRRTGKTNRELLQERFNAQETERSFFGSRVFLVVASLTLMNIIFLGGASSQMLHFMDESHFCGTACHTVMNPEWVTYQQSPHARVQCVECHVGEGLENLIDSKLNGVRQIISVTFDLYERPIPTPVHSLRPSRETCEKCHWPDKFYGQRLRTFTHYQENEESTPYYTSLIQKVDAGTAGMRAGIHWHIGQENQIRYTSVDDERREMIWVEVRQPDGSYKRFVNQALEGGGDENIADESLEVRILDCIDCHNRATHIYEPPDLAVDKRIERGLIDRSLPYIKREALAAISGEYADDAAAMSGIETRLLGFYRDNYPGVLDSMRVEIENAVAVLQQSYRRNIHHQMNIDWNTYQSLLGHRNDEGGCFRCHTSDLADEEGNEISYDCDLCHSILAYEEDQPFASTFQPDARGRLSAAQGGIGVQTTVSLHR